MQCCVCPLLGGHFFREPCMSLHCKYLYTPCEHVLCVMWCRKWALYFNPHNVDRIWKSIIFFLIFWHNLTSTLDFPTWMCCSQMVTHHLNNQDLKSCNMHWLRSSWKSSTFSHRKKYICRQCVITLNPRWEQHLIPFLYISSDMSRMQSFVCILTFHLPILLGLILIPCVYCFGSHEISFALQDRSIWKVSVAKQVGKQCSGSPSGSSATLPPTRACQRISLIITQHTFVLSC